MATYTSEFNAEDPKYQCCCGRCHVVTGTKIYLFLYAMSVGSQGASVGLLWSLLSGIIPIVVIVITVIGLYKEEPGKMWPFIILTGITFVLVSIFALIVLVLSLFSSASLIHALGEMNNKFDESEYESGDSIVFVTVVIELVFVAALALLYWQWRVVCCCKQYFEEKRWACGNAGQQQQNLTHSTALVSNVSSSASPAYSTLMAQDEKEH